LNDKTINMSDVINSGEDFLAHYGIKGQQWGQRRFQNEDGTLTPEGRRRYGLNPKYAGMSDKEIREALEKKRTQNKYVELMTEGPRKKQSEIKEFTKTAFSTAKTGVGVLDATKWQAVKKEADDAIKEETKLLKGKKPGDPIYDKAQENIQMYKNVKEGYKAGKDFLDKALSSSEYPSTFIAKSATEKELKEKTAEAKRNIQELEHEELKKTVDRMLLEKQYDELVNPPAPSKIERGRETLQTIGSVLGVVLTAATLAKLLKDWKGKSVAQSDEDGEYLAHYRTKGSKNGVRRYQNEDGSLTPEGYRHYGIDPNGRQAADPRELLARQRVQQQMQAREAKAQRRQAGYTQKFQQRQAIRDARNQAAIQRVYDKQSIRTQREQLATQNRAAAENRKNIRRNIVKGVAAVAAIGAALYAGRHFLQQRALDNQYVRDIGKMNIENKAKLEQIKAQLEPIKYEKETERILGEKKLNIDKYEKETTRILGKENAGLEKYKAETDRISKNTQKSIPKPEVKSNKPASKPEAKPTPKPKGSGIYSDDLNKTTFTEAEVEKNVEEQRKRTSEYYERQMAKQKEGYEKRISELSNRIQTPASAPNQIPKSEAKPTPTTQTQSPKTAREIVGEERYQRYLDRKAKLDRKDEENARDARTRDHKQGWDDIRKREVEVEASRRELERQDILEARMTNFKKRIDEENARDARTRDHKQAWDKLVKTGALEKAQVRNGIIFDRRTRKRIDKRQVMFLRNYLGHEEELIYVVN